MTINENDLENRYEIDPIECSEITTICGKDAEEYSCKRIEILYQSEGDCKIKLGVGEATLKCGELMILNSGTAYGISAGKKDGKTVRIGFVPGIICDTYYSMLELKYIMPFLTSSDGAKLIKAALVKKAHIGAIVDNILTEYNNSFSGRMISIRSDIIRIFVFIIRQLETDGYTFEPAVSEGELINSISRSIEYMKKDLANVNEKEIAEICGLSYSYFSRSFKRIMHMSFSEYCNKLRVTASEKMLIETDMPISEIADKLGFSSASHYIQTFRKFKNCSPKKYRTYIRTNKI